MRTCLALMLTAALAVPALAQRPGGGGGFGMMGPGALLANKSVQEELKLTEDQITKVKEFAAKQAEARKGLRDPNLSQEERREKMTELNKQAGEFAKETLKDDQAKRFKEIQYQVGGVNNAEAQKELKITDEQKDKIKEINDAMGKEMRELFQPGSPPDAETMKKIAGLRKDSAEKAVGVLNDDQKKQWKEMTGKAFEVKFEGFGPGGDTPKKKKKKDKDGQ